MIYLKTDIKKMPGCCCECKIRFSCKKAFYPKGKHATPTDCPLTELPGRDEAREILFKALPFSALSRLKSDDIKKIIDKLGFKEGV